MSAANATLTLVSHKLCPYVQRAVISLTEKGVPYERVDIDLSDKPDWFKAISPLGKTPLLRVGDAVIFESAMILEYIEETQGHPLHPVDPLARAEHRSWVEFASAILNDIWGFYSAPDKAVFDAKAAALKEKFARIEAWLRDAPWFAGERFSLVDAAFGPVFRYFDAFDTIGDFGILEGLTKTAAWRRRLAERASVKGAVAPEYPVLLWRFLEASGSHLARLMTEKNAPTLAAYQRRACIDDKAQMETAAATPVAAAFTGSQKLAAASFSLSGSRRSVRAHTRTRASPARDRCFKIRLPNDLRSSLMPVPSLGVSEAPHNR